MLRTSLYACLMSIALLAPAMADDFTLSPAIKARAAAKEKPTFVVSYHDPALSVAVPMRKGVEAAAKELGVNAIFAGPVGGGAEKQVAELENWITKGVDGLAVSSSSTDALAPVIKQGAGGRHSRRDVQHRQPRLEAPDLRGAGSGLFWRRYGRHTRQSDGRQGQDSHLHG